MSVRFGISSYNARVAACSAVTFFRSGRNMARKQLLASSYPFVRPYLRPHGTTRFPLHGFS